MCRGEDEEGLNQCMYRVGSGGTARGYGGIEASDLLVDIIRRFKSKIN